MGVYLLAIALATGAWFLANSFMAVTAPVVTVALNPPGSSTVVATKTLVITATVTGSTHAAVTWAVDGVINGNATVGTITGSGNTVTYTAPASAGSRTVTATSAANSAGGASIVLAVTPAVIVSPSAPTAVGSGGQLTFAATVTGSARGRVAWSVDAIKGGNTTIGTISTAGVYTCPTVSTPTIHTITATSVATPEVSASVRILTTKGNTTYNAKTGYGATGNGSTDDTAAITSALAAAAGNICYLPPGTYMINATANCGGTAGLDIPANTCLYMAPGATLQCITQSTTKMYRVVRMAANNTSVVGGAVIGDRMARNLPLSDSGNSQYGVPPDFEEGDGIDINAASCIVILGVTTRDCCCDGILMYNGVSNVTVSDCVSDNNRRQGLSIVQGNDITIQYSTFSNTAGNDPGAGIDIEPAGSGQICTAITINRCNITGNRGGGIIGGSSHASVDHITVSASTIAGNGGSNYGYGGIYFNDGAGFCTFADNTVTGNLAGVKDGGIVLSGVTRMIVKNNTVTGNAGYGLSFTQAAGTTYSGNTVTGNSSGQIHNDGTASAVK